MTNKETYRTGTRLTIEVGEHIYITPPIPPKGDIINHDKPVAEQYWTRQKDFPKFFEAWHNDVEIDAKQTEWDGKRLISLDKEETNILIKFRDRELQRMIDGVWFMNKGIPTYLTGGHYFALQWGAMKGAKNDVELRSIYGKYMRFQRNYCYFIEICKVTKVARGGNVVKPKKTGITMLQALLILCDAMIERTCLFRIMSTKEDVAKDTNFGYVSYALEKLPPILTPSYRKNMGEAYFGNPDPSRQTSKKKKTDIEYLDSWIQTVATLVNSFDSQTNKVAWVDEQSKIEISGGDLEQLHNTSLPTVMQGLDRYGYIIYTHYVSEKNNKSFRQAKKIYYDGKLKTADKVTGMVASKMICYAMTVLDGIFGACDKYGDPDLKLIWGEINGQQEALKDNPGALRAYKRQMPTCEDDMWMEMAGADSVFDNFRLSIKQKQIMENESIGVLPFDFNLRWSKNPEIDDIKKIYKFEGIPMIVPVTDEEKRAGKSHGAFKWHRRELLPEFFLKKHMYQLGKDKKGNWKPLLTCPFYAHMDPVNYSDALDVVVGSKNAIQVSILPNSELDGYFGKRVSNKRPFINYLIRSDSPQETLMHTVMILMMFGCYMILENNMPWLRTKLKEWGFANFIMMLNKDGVLEPYNEFAEGQKPFTSQKDTIEQYVNAGRLQIGGPGTEYNEIDNVEYLDDLDTVTQLMNFDSKNTTKFDAAVCYLIGQYGMDSYLGWRQAQLDKANRKTDGIMGLAARGLLR